MITPSAQLRTTIELALPALRAATSRAWEHPTPALYRDFLATSHMAVSATETLLECAADQARRLAGQDAVSAGLLSYLAEQRENERAHDIGLLEDYAAAGGQVADLLQKMPVPAVAEMVGAQYYWIRHHHPVTLLGHIAVREGYPPAEALIDRIRHSTGLPADAFRTLREHCVADRDHRAALMSVLDALPLGKHHRAATGIAALHTVQKLVTLLDQLLVHVPSSYLERRP
jgi:heme oxygenase-like protein